jgi:hypothetical protein
MNSQPTLPAATITPKLSARGNYWEVTYKESISPFESWRLVKASDLATETGKANVEVTADLGTRAVNLKNKMFEICDFNHFNLDDSSFVGCSFVDCRFIKSDFHKVKFSKCRFEKCHFLNVTFQGCLFLDSTFSKISASAEQLHFVRSSISAGEFVDALVTNLDALPEGIEPEYQTHRLLSTKAKIAGAILLSLRDEPDPEKLSDANRCFEIALQRRQIAEARWTETEKVGQLVKRRRLYRSTAVPLRMTALGIMRMAGFFTDWGRSPIKSVWFLVGAVLVFSGVYSLLFDQEFLAALLRALDCTFVFGYTKYQLGVKPKAIDYVMFANAFFGLWWYALLVPALSNRLFR